MANVLTPGEVGAKRRVRGSVSLETPLTLASALSLRERVPSVAFRG
jgi:hypothetical protein